MRYITRWWMTNRHRPRGGEGVHADAPRPSRLPRARGLCPGRAGLLRQPHPRPAFVARVRGGAGAAAIRAGRCGSVRGGPARAGGGPDRSDARDAGLLAVRSSAAGEDGRRHSFAGQLKSFLYVRPEDLETRVADVWRSGFGEAVYAYRAEHGLPSPPPAPAVIVQRMIDPDAAGVAFSADPLTGNRSLALVASAFGAGTAVVSDEADSDLHQVDPARPDREAPDRPKRLGVPRRARHPEGVAPVPVDGDAVSAAALTDTQARRVADAARRIEVMLGVPRTSSGHFAATGCTSCRPARSPPCGRPPERGRAPDLGQQQHRRELRRHHHPAHLLLRAARLRGCLPPVLPHDARAGRGHRRERPGVRAHDRPDPRPRLLQPAELVPHARDCFPGTRSTGGSWNR